MSDSFSEIVEKNYPIFRKLKEVRGDASAQSAEKIHHVAIWLLHWHRLHSDDRTAREVFSEIEQILEK